MQEPVFGETRTFVGQRHALIAPDGHVPSRLPGFEGATPYYMISPAMGGNLVQMSIVFEPGGSACFDCSPRQRFIYVEEGNVECEKKSLNPGSYLYWPAADAPVAIRAKDESAVITVFEAPFEQLPNEPKPEALYGNANEIKGEPFLGNQNAVLQVLLPDEIGWDMAVNIFTYQPGATLPFVETHIMEHGLLMLSGQGIYRLEDRYYPVAKGDVIWMAPYCPQWFVAMGEEPASYLYYKNVNRHGWPDSIG